VSSDDRRVQERPNLSLDTAVAVGGFDGGDAAALVGGCNTMRVPLRARSEGIVSNRC